MRSASVAADPCRACALARRSRGRKQEQQARRLPPPSLRLDPTSTAISSTRLRPPSIVASAAKSAASSSTASRAKGKASSSASSTATRAAEKYVLRDDDGSVVRVAVAKKTLPTSSTKSANDDGVFAVTVEVELSPREASLPTLAWGTYRAARGVWRAPSPLPAGATADAETGGARTPFVAGDDGGATATLELPARSAPFSLAFFVDRGGEDEPRRHAVPVGMGAGSAARLGASLVVDPSSSSSSVNFCVTSRHAASMSLVLARLKGGDGPGGEAPLERVGNGGGTLAPVWRAATSLEVALDPSVHRTGDCWHVRVDGLADLESLCWGWRAGGELVTDAGGRFSPGQVMLDPYARDAAWARLPDGVNVAPPSVGSGELDPLEEPPALLGCLGSLVSVAEEEDGERERLLARRRRKSRADDDATVVLEVDPRSPSSIALSPSVPEQHRGKLFGIIDAIDASPPYLFGSHEDDGGERRTRKGAGGVTAVLLRGPVTVAVPGFGSAVAGAPAPLSLLAPDPSLAVDGSRDLMAASRELRQFVRALHARGIDAYASLEVCFTGESEPVGDGAAGSTTPLAGRAFSLRGLDAATFYKPGTRVLDSGNPATRSLAVEAARTLALSFGFDGVQLENAEATSADSNGAVLDSPPLPESLAFDPVLRGDGVRLFASAADESLLPRSGVRGFPHWGAWGERNWRCARDVSRLMLDGDAACSSAVATRAAGSPDLTSPAWGAADARGAPVPGNLAAGRPRAAALNCVVSPRDHHAPSGDVLEAAVSRAVPPGSAPPRERDALAKALVVAGAMFRGTPLLPEAAAALAPGGGGVFVGARFLESLLAVRARHAAALAPREDGGSVHADGGDGGGSEALSSAAASAAADESGDADVASDAESSSPSLSSVASVTATPRPGSPPPRPTRSYDSSYDSDGDGFGLGGGKRKGATSLSRRPIPAIRWHGAHAASQPDWDGERSSWGEWGCSVVAWSIVYGEGERATSPSSPSPSSPPSSSHASSGIYVALNPHPGPVALTLPPPPSGSGGWRRAIDTSLASPDDAAPAASILGGDDASPPLLSLGSSDYELGSRAALVLVAEPKKQTRSRSARD